MFNLPMFKKDYQTQLMGANWFKVTTDEYIRYMLANNNSKESVICDGVEGYEPPCPVGDGTVIIPQLALVYLLLMCVIHVLSV